MPEPLPNCRFASERRPGLNSPAAALFGLCLVFYHSPKKQPPARLSLGEHLTLNLKRFILTAGRNDRGHSVRMSLARNRST